MYLIVLLFISFNCFAGQSFISASYLSSEDESTQQYLSLGTQIFKNGNISIFGLQNNYEGDGEEIQTQGYGFDYSHKLNKYFFGSGGGNGLQEGEYLVSSTSYGSLGVNLNFLWGSLIKTQIELTHQETYYSYYREFNIRTIDRSFYQIGNSLRLSQEIFLWLDIDLFYTKYTYTENPVDVVDSVNPNVLNFLPEYQSLLYGAPDYSKGIALNFIFDSYEISLYHRSTYNLVTEDDEFYNSIDFTYAFKAFDFNLRYAWSELDEVVDDQQQVGITLYF